MIVVLIATSTILAFLRDKYHLCYHCVLDEIVYENTVGTILGLAVLVQAVNPPKPCKSEKRPCASH